MLTMSAQVNLAGDPQNVHFWRERFLVPTFSSQMLSQSTCEETVPKYLSLLISMCRSILAWLQQELKVRPPEAWSQSPVKALFHAWWGWHHASKGSFMFYDLWVYIIYEFYYTCIYYIYVRITPRNHTLTEGKPKNKYRLFCNYEPLFHEMQTLIFNDSKKD